MEEIFYKAFMDELNKLASEDEAEEKEEKKEEKKEDKKEDKKEKKEGVEGKMDAFKKYRDQMKEKKEE